MTDDIYSRQEGFIPQSYIKDKNILLIGCGNLGSVVGVTLSKMGFNKFMVVDPDIIEEHNIPNQWFTSNSIGRNKANELQNVLVKYHPEYWREHTPTRSEEFRLSHLFSNPDIIIIAVDSTKARKKIIEIINYYHDNMNDRDFLIIDVGTNQFLCRLTAFHVSEGEKLRTYYAQLVEWNKTADDRVCGRSSTLFIAQFVASMVGTYIYKQANDQKTEFQEVIDCNLMFKFPFNLPEPLNVAITQKVLNEEMAHYRKTMLEGMQNNEQFIFLSITSHSSNTVQLADGIDVYPLKEHIVRGQMMFSENCITCLCRYCNTTCPINKCKICLEEKDERTVKYCKYFIYRKLIANLSSLDSTAESMFNKLVNLTREQIDKIIEEVAGRVW